MLDSTSQKLEQLQRELFSWIKDENKIVKNHQISLVFIQLLSSCYFRRESNKEEKHPLLASQVKKINSSLFNHLIQLIDF